MGILNYLNILACVGCLGNQVEAFGGLLTAVEAFDHLRSGVFFFKIVHLVDA